MNRAGRLEDQTCLIVGGTGGIGLATAQRFLCEGARVVVSGRTTEEAQLAAEALGGQAEAIAADLGEPGVSSADAANLIGEAVRRLGGRLDILFHVAGISGRSMGDGPLAECSLEGWERVLFVNATAAFLTNQAAVRQMLTQPLNRHGLRGAVLNLGSVLSRSPSPKLFGTIAYAASKGALESLTLAAAARYAADRIRFNLLAPSLIDTPMSRRAMGDPRIQTYLRAKQPIRGGAGEPDDVAEAALFLCEPASRFLTGEILTVDGGWRIAEGVQQSDESS